MSTVSSGMPVIRCILIQRLVVALATPFGRSNDRYLYSFTLPVDSRLYFDMLSPHNSNFSWSLTGPTGAVVSGRAFPASDSADIGNPVLHLIAGDYLLTISATNGATGSYSFRLLDIGSTTEITPGTPVWGELNPGQETNVYSFIGNAGDTLYFDSISRSGAAYAYWS